ncbi:hypothetical protein ENFAE_17990 [Enterococcus faecalis]|uniref:hypothetical protein n=1 Tax=Enterococcus faecalis TaxID=1351 RepID=UPI000893978C|nr:hypothetical protein [Enterococcus faecalis]OFA12388.1 hypothetical protein ENFAE_17990 [Enterococcus faecalis]
MSKTIKRFTLSLVTDLNDQLVKIASMRGTSKNKLINDACWKFVEDFEKKYGKIEKED